MITVKRFEFNYFSENTYLLFDETKEALLIDCGALRPEEEQALSHYVAQNDLTIRRYLCTHLHLDHIFGNAFVRETFGVSPEAHLAEAEVIPPASEQAKRFGIPSGIKDIPVARFLTEGETVQFGNAELQVLHVPGHSPGSLCFYSAADGFVVVGDALFEGSIGRADLWGGDMELLVSSIQTKLLTLPDETIVYSGHGAKTTILNEKLNNPYL